MDLIIGGAVILLVGSFAAWKLLRRSGPNETRAAASAPPVTTQPSKAREDAPAVSRTQTCATPSSEAQAKPPQQVHDYCQTTAKTQAAKAPAAPPVPAHVASPDKPRANKAVAATKTPQSQNAAALAAEARPGAKDEGEDWLGFVPSLTAKGNDDADTELVLEDD
jgi:hypothetical protein